MDHICQFSILERTAWLGESFHMLMEHDMNLKMNEIEARARSFGMRGQCCDRRSMFRCVG